MQRRLLANARHQVIGQFTGGFVIVGIEQLQQDQQGQVQLALHDELARAVTLLMLLLGTAQGTQQGRPSIHNAPLRCRHLRVIAMMIDAFRRRRHRRLIRLIIGQFG